LMSKSNESFADVHLLLDFFSHVHIHGHPLHREISKTCDQGTPRSDIQTKGASAAVGMAEATLLGGSLGAANKH
jgi:hypothetical protein